MFYKVLGKYFCYFTGDNLGKRKFEDEESSLEPTKRFKGDTPEKS